MGHRRWLAELEEVQEQMRAEMARHAEAMRALQLKRRLLKADRNKLMEDQPGAKKSRRASLPAHDDNDNDDDTCELVADDDDTSCPRPPDGGV